MFPVRFEEVAKSPEDFGDVIQRLFRSLVGRFRV